MKTKTILYGLAGIGIILVAGLLYLQFGVDHRITIDPGYKVGNKLCNEKFCVTPLAISSDRHTGSLLVYDLNADKTCVQDINNGELVPLYIYDCRPGSDWNGERSGTGFIIDDGFSS